LIGDIQAHLGRIVRQVGAGSEGHALWIPESEFSQIPLRHDLTVLGQLDQFLQRDEMEVPGSWIEGDVLNIREADGWQIDLGDNGGVNGPVRLRLDTDQAGSSGIQEEQIPALWIDGQALRILQTKVPGIVADQCPGDQITVRSHLNLDQSIRRGLEDEHAIEAFVKRHVAWIPDRRRDAS
jgi:hypothetical protein